MTLNQAIKSIVKDYDVLKTKSQYERLSEAVWVAVKDKSADYSVDIERLGITEDGQIVWAYASGCSCWEGDYSEESPATVKEFFIKDTLLEWRAAIIKFAETHEEQDLA
jgi:hypothetical protein